jgi:hypothetical protein
LVFNTEKSGIQLLSFHCHALCFTWRMWVLWGFAGKKMSGTSIFQKESSFKRYVRGFNLFIGFFAATKFHFMHAIVVEVKHNISVQEHGFLPYFVPWRTWDKYLNWWFLGVEPLEINAGVTLSFDN